MSGSPSLHPLCAFVCVGGGLCFSDEEILTLILTHEHVYLKKSPAIFIKRFVCSLFVALSTCRFYEGELQFRRDKSQFGHAPQLRQNPIFRSGSDLRREKPESWCPDQWQRLEHATFCKQNKIDSHVVDDDDDDYDSLLVKTIGRCVC
jgi:hypothetical protein